MTAPADDPNWWVRRSARRRVRRVLGWHPDVTIDDEGIRCKFDDTSIATLTWDDIQEVGVWSMRRPLIGTDLFMVFRGPGDKAIPIPYHETPLNLLEEIGRLPDFDANEAMQAVAALKGTVQFVCWRRSHEHERAK